MKKLTLKIRQNTKAIILGLAILAGAGFSALHPKEGVKSSLAFVGLVATFKKKGIDLDADEQKHFEAIDGVLEANFKGLLSAEDATKQLSELKATIPTEAAMKKLSDGIDEMNEAYKKAQSRIDQLATNGLGGQVASKGFKAQLIEQMKSKDFGEYAQWAKSNSPGQKGFEFEIKAATDMTVAGTTAYTTAGTNIAMPQPEFIPGLNDVARNQPFIMPLLNVRGTSNANIVYVEKYNPQGSAGWVAEGAAGSEVSFDIQISNSRAKMITAYIKVSTQMLDDVDYIASEIQKELMYKVAIAVDTALLQGDGTGDSLKGIKAFAPAYALTTLSTTSPNNCDAIVAAKTQITAANFIADTAVLNPIDFAQTTLLKGSTGYYIVNPNNSDSTWANIRVVQSNQVPVGYVMVMDSAKTNVLLYQNLTIAYGYVNDDFTKHLVTIQATQRLHSFVKLNDVNAFVYDTLQNIKDAITAV